MGTDQNTIADPTGAQPPCNSAGRGWLPDSDGRGRQPHLRLAAGANYEIVRDLEPHARKLAALR